MTTPNQSLPSTVETLLGIGAFQVADPGTTNYGQNVSSDFVTGLVQGPIGGLLGGGVGIGDIGSVIESISEFLLTLPLQVFQMLSGVIPGTSPSDFNSVSSAVGTIMGFFSNVALLPVTTFFSFIELFQHILGGESLDDSLTDFANSVPLLAPVVQGFQSLMNILGNPLGLLTGEVTFPEFLSHIPILNLLLDSDGNFNLDFLPSLSQLATIVQQILDIINGLLVTPINSAVSGVVDFFTSLFGQITHLGPTGLLPGSAVSGPIDGTQVQGILGGNIVDNVTNLGTQVAQQILGPGTITDPITGVVDGIQSILDSIFGIAHTVAQISSTQAATGGGTVFSIDFSTVPAGAITNAPLIVNYTGGTSATYLQCTGAAVSWHNALTGDRTAKAWYKNGSTTDLTSDYQMVTSPLAAPNQGIVVYGFLRANAAHDTYVYAAGYQASWANYRVQVGCVVGGTQTVFIDTGIAYSTQLKFLAGVAGNPYRFQVYSGATVFADYTDSAHVSQLGSSYRQAGFGSNTSGGFAGPDTSYITWQDNPN